MSMRSTYQKNQLNILVAEGLRMHCEANNKMDCIGIEVSNTVHFSFLVAHALNLQRLNTWGTQALPHRMELQFAHHLHDENQVATEEQFKDNDEDVAVWPPAEAENIDVVLFVTIGVLQTCKFRKGALACFVLESIGFLFEYTMYFLK